MTRGYRDPLIDFDFSIIPRHYVKRVGRLFSIYQNQDEPFLKALALACLCSAVAKNLVVSELPPAPCQHQNASYGCKAFKKKNPCASARKTFAKNLNRKPNQKNLRSLVVIVRDVVRVIVNNL